MADVSKIDFGDGVQRDIKDAYVRENYIAKSSTTGLVKNDGTIDTNTYTPSKVLTGTLTTGSTTLTLTDSSITSNSLIDVYTTVFGLSPTNITASTGTLTLTFAEQESDVGVKVIIM